MDKINDLRILDPIKISMVGLDMFMKKYEKNKNITSLIERMRVLEALSESRDVSEADKENMKGILEDLNKIMTCNLCHKEINWDKNEGLYAIQPEVSGRHNSCHIKNYG